jgi:hypothetical protein
VALGVAIEVPFCPAHPGLAGADVSAPRPDFSLAHTRIDLTDARQFSQLRGLSLCDRTARIPMKPKPKRERRVTAERRANPRSGRRSTDSHEGRELRVTRAVEYMRKQTSKKTA